jgi:hypothetical protein
MTSAQAWDLIEVMLNRIPDVKTRDLYVTFHRVHREKALSLPASVKHHHSWPGGYAVHIWEVMTNLKDILHGVMLPKGMGFTATDSITSSYVHDLDKLLYRYEEGGEPPSPAQLKLARDKGVPVDANDTKAIVSLKLDNALQGTPLDLARLPRHQYRKKALEMEDGAIVAWLCAQHSLPLTEQALHAVCVHHGGFSALARTTRDLDVQPLGCFLHTADYMSSNVQLGNVEPKETAAQPEPVYHGDTFLGNAYELTPPPPPPESFQ